MPESPTRLLRGSLLDSLSTRKKGTRIEQAKSMNAPSINIGTGIYSISEASRLTGVPSRSIRRWLWGYEFKSQGEVKAAEPLWTPEHDVIEDSQALGFRDLIEIRFVAAFKAEGVSLQTIRAALDKATDLFGAYPLSSVHFRTDGKSIFAALAESTGERMGFDLPTGQMIFNFMLEKLYPALEYDDSDRPLRWRPSGPDRDVVVDPQRNFGKPIVVGGVPTDVLYSSYLAEDKSILTVANWYGVSEKAVADAVSFETQLAA